MGETQFKRRRVDAESVVETVSRGPKSVVYGCGCVAVDPTATKEQLQLLECPTHAALRAKLRRRQTDRFDG